MLNRGGGGDGSGGGERVHFEWRQSACSEIFSFTLLKYFFFSFFFCGYNYYYEHRGLRILCIIFLRDWICKDSNYTLISFFFFNEMF